MGSGFKDFAAGDILTAADVDGYLMRQTVMTFADASARDSALSGVLDEGMVAYLENTNSMTVYDGSSWLGGWTTFSPSITAFSGTFTTTTVNTAIYNRLNGTIVYYLDVTLDNIGTASGALRSSLPITAQSALAGTAFGREVNLTGFSINGELFNTGGVSLLEYDGSSVIANNARVRAITIYREQ